MRWILLAVSGFCLAAWIVLGSTDQPFGQPLPALGQLYHPTLGLWQNALPQHTHPLQGRVSIGHPLAKGQVFYDERDIPHIFADSISQLLFIQGYVTARDRLWQMDISTRSTGGELAAVLGEKLVNRDQRQIRHGFRAAAELAVKTWQAQFPAEYALLEAYAAGVNAYIDQLEPQDYPIEYKLMGFGPRPWTPYHSALMLKGMTQSMTDRSSDAAFSKALKELGIERYQELFPKWNPNQTPIVPVGTKYNFAAASPRQRSPLPVIGEENRQPAAAPSPVAKPGKAVEQAKISGLFNDYHPQNGSNNWAIAGSKSLTGRPILAGDPHLGLTLPSIWYELQLSTENNNIRGVSLPGLPFVVIGFNDDIAWSMTNGQQDVVDYYRMDWVDTTRMEYRIAGQKKAVLLRQDTIKIKGSDPQIITTKWTERGPIAVEDPDSPYAGLAKDAIYLYTQTDRPFTEIEVLKRIMVATDFRAFEAACRGYSEPIMNFAYADRHGDIAMLVNGFLPLRSKGDSTKTRPGQTISDGSLAQPNWTGYVPFEQMPRQYNPRRGFVASANQAPTDANYPYSYYGSFIDWRGRYINRKLAQAKRMDYKDIQALQQDAHSMMAEQLLPLLLARIKRSQLNEQGLRWFMALAEWDYAYTQENKAASFFERWRRSVYRLTTDELSRADGFPGLEYWKWIELLRRQPNHPIFDIQATDNRETAATLTQRAFDELLEEEEENPIPIWVQERDGQLNHLGLIPGFGSGLLRTDGHNTAPNATMRGHGPSWRMVVELGEKVHAYGLLPGGASGNPASPNFEGGVAEWSRGRYFDLSFWTTLAEAERKASGQLIFE